MTGPPGVAVGCLGLPSLQHPLGELQATAGVPPAEEAVVLAGEVVAAGEVLPPTMGVGVADDVVEDAGEGLLLCLACPAQGLHYASLARPFYTTGGIPYYIITVTFSTCRLSLICTSGRMLRTRRWHGAQALVVMHKADASCYHVNWTQGVGLCNT